MELAVTPTDHLHSPFGGQLSITFLEVKEDNGDLMTKDRRRQRCEKSLWPSITRKEVRIFHENQMTDLNPSILSLIRSIFGMGGNGRTLFHY